MSIKIKGALVALAFIANCEIFTWIILAVIIAPSVLKFTKEALEHD